MLAEERIKSASPPLPSYADARQVIQLAMKHAERQEQARLQRLYLTLLAGAVLLVVNATTIITLHG